MKILVPGNPESKRFKCKSCGCVFEAVYGEYSSLPIDSDIDGDVDKHGMQRIVNVEYKCHCPCCDEICKAGD